MDYQSYDPATGRVIYSPADAARIREPFMSAPYAPSDHDPDPSIAFGGPVSVGDLAVDDGDENIGDIGEQPSDTRPNLFLPADDDLPPHTELPATVAIGDEQVPSQAEQPGDIPKRRQAGRD